MELPASVSTPRPILPHSLSYHPQMGVRARQTHRRFLGTTREVNHKTSTQLENWIELLTDMPQSLTKAQLDPRSP